VHSGSIPPADQRPLRDRAASRLAGTELIADDLYLLAHDDR
jgi:hypothetical protein